MLGGSEVNFGQLSDWMEAGGPKWGIIPKRSWVIVDALLLEVGTASLYPI